MKCAIGDIHGDFCKLRDLLSRIEEETGHRFVKDDIIFMCGDVGLHYGKYYSADLHEFMSGFPATFFVIRGNHDVRYIDYLNDTDDFIITRWNGGKAGYHKYSDNIIYAADEGDLYTIDSDEILIVPGAYSVDKRYRQALGLPYEPREQLDEDELSRLICIAKKSHPKFVLSHTAPRDWECEISKTFLNGIEQNSVDKTMENALDDILQAVAPTLKKWFFGHFHSDMEVDNGRGVMLMYDYRVFGE